MRDPSGRCTIAVMTQICVPIMVEEHASAIRDATLAAEHGADLVEFRVDVFFEDK